jgi:hypothetical protein
MLTRCRNRRAAVASMVVVRNSILHINMLYLLIMPYRCSLNSYLASSKSQFPKLHQPRNIGVLTVASILAFLASVFFTAANLTDSTGDTVKQNLGLGVGFGAANAIFSTIAYWLIEPLPHDMGVEDADEEIITPPSEDAPTKEARKVARKKEARQQRVKKLQELLYGRRRLLLQSLFSGTVMLFILTFLLRLPKENSAKLGAVTTFIFLFTLCYSPGAGAVPFLYSAEIWPNEGRGMLVLLCACAILMLF